MMDDLVTWLRAQLDQRQERAERAQPGPWAAWPSGLPGEFVVHRVSRRTGQRDPARIATTHGLRCAAEDAEYIAEQDPDFVIREVEAKRLALKECDDAETDCNAAPGTLQLADAVRKVLALPFSDRPGYREEWKP